MVNLNNEVVQLKTEINLLKGETLNEIVIKGNELNEKLHKRWLMISGEGAVFITLLLLGIFQIRKTFKKEAKLAPLDRLPSFPFAPDREPGNAPPLLPRSRVDL